MQKYSFLVYHKEYESFLKNMQKLGALHVIEKNSKASDDVNGQYKLLREFSQTIEFLQKREVEEASEVYSGDALQIVRDVIKKQARLAELEQELAIASVEMGELEPWGDFSTEHIDKLKEQGVNIKFYTISKKKFNEKQLAHCHAEIIGKTNTHVYFIVLQHGNAQVEVDAMEVEQPKQSIWEVQLVINRIEYEMSIINNSLDFYTETSVPLLIKERDALLGEIQFNEVAANTLCEADEKMKVLEGWIPDSKKNEIIGFLEKREILYTVEKPTEDEKVPILLKNNKFSSLFEPIGKLFSLPSYSELDLTVFFAPFFMLFFGFCLGDAGYGLLFLVGASLYKLKAKKEIKPVLSLIQVLGTATIIFGAISGTIFGVNLIETEFALLSKYRSYFFDSNNMFNLALVLGAIQIVFGIIVRAMNKIKQFGFMHSLSTIGWLIVLLGAGVYMGLTEYGVVEPNTNLLYLVLSLGGFLIIFFSDVKVGIPARIGKGIWDIYSTVTGIFGDLLSYIRLFALGLSSAILGFVINDIALQILDSGTIIGPIFFVIFLLLGHGLNIMISSLGSFVHPMRLTFVEFYKNAGFAGGGKEYKPFSEAVKTK